MMATPDITPKLFFISEIEYSVLLDHTFIYLSNLIYKENEGPAKQAVFRSYWKPSDCIFLYTSAHKKKHYESPCINKYDSISEKV
jgi:hypothetical protein